jgi:hypothetical protein
VCGITVTAGKLAYYSQSVLPTYTFFLKFSRNIFRRVKVLRVLVGFVVDIVAQYSSGFGQLGEVCRVYRIPHECAEKCCLLLNRK